MTVAEHLVKWMWWLKFLLRTIALNCYSRLFCLRLILESTLFLRLFPLSISFIRSGNIYFILVSDIGT